MQNEQQGGGASPASIQEYLAGLDYPASKSEIISYAKEQGAPDDVVQTLNRLSGERYNAPTDVTEELGRQM